MKKTMKSILGMGFAGAGMYLAAVMPRMLNRPDSHDGLFEKKFFAHRGLHDNESDAPENSLAAFQKAVDAGFGIELDVHVTKDHIPVVFHDFKLGRICGVDGVIEDHTYEELQAYTLCNSGERIPRFSDVLTLVDGKVPLIVEIKSETTDMTSCTYIDEELKRYKGRYCIESFNPMVLFWYRRHRSEVIRGQLSSDFKKECDYKGVLYFVIQHLLFNGIAKPDFVAYNQKFENEPGRKLCRYLFKLPMAAWTVKSQEELELAKKEFDVFIFDSFVPEKGD